MASKSKQTATTQQLTASAVACTSAIKSRAMPFGGMIRRATGVSLETTPPECMAAVIFEAEAWEQNSLPTVADAIKVSSPINRAALDGASLPVEPRRSREISHMVQAWCEQGKVSDSPTPLSH